MVSKHLVATLSSEFGLTGIAQTDLNVFSDDVMFRLACQGNAVYFQLKEQEFDRSLLSLHEDLFPHIQELAFKVWSGQFDPDEESFPLRYGSTRTELRS